MAHFKHGDHYCRTPRQMIDNFYYVDGKRDWPIDTIWPCPGCGRKYKMYKQWDNEGMGATYGWTPVKWYEKEYWTSAKFEWKENWK